MLHQCKQAQDLFIKLCVYKVQCTCVVQLCVLNIRIYCYTPSLSLILAHAHTHIISFSFTLTFLLHPYQQHLYISLHPLGQCSHEKVKAALQKLDHVRESQITKLLCGDKALGSTLLLSRSQVQTQLRCEESPLVLL